MSDVELSHNSRSANEILDELAELRTKDIDWKNGRAFSLVYNSDDHELETLLETVGKMFLHENALNPFKYETLMKMETEVISMATSMVGAASGAMTSGGTESIFLAIQTARDHALERGIERPELICCDTAHPAFAKACKYLGVTQTFLAHGSDGRAVPERYAEAINDQTAVVVVSTPCYPFGVIDPVSDIAGIANERGVLCHVDACLGGFLLPWWEKLGESVVPWTFAVDGVTSMSADIHKYGYTFKGASMVMYANDDLYRKQIFMYDAWPGGLYASSTAAGTRSGAPIAGAWTAMTHLGEEGYLRLGSRVIDATRRFQSGITAIDSLEITSDPDMSLFEFSSNTYDVAAIADVMDDRGWNLDRQQGGLHLMVAPGHDAVVDEFCSDLEFAVNHHGHARDSNAMYGGVVGES